MSTLSLTCYFELLTCVVLDLLPSAILRGENIMLLYESVSSLLLLNQLCYLFLCVVFANLIKNFTN